MDYTAIVDESKLEHHETQACGLNWHWTVVDFALSGWTRDRRTAGQRQESYRYSPELAPSA
ncbi:MAG: hypothetical protein CMQ29_14130 [Gammaproteobacteria bacterium]|nr:hypothetical protein [Gammaproteobacteria bacterium]